VRVLVVEDDADSREMVSTLLSRVGARVLTAASAAEGYERLGRERPDVLVADIGMPGEDGYSLMRRIRHLSPSAGGATPAIALTAHARLDDRDRALAAGFDYHAAKPVEPAGLVTLIAAAAASARRAG
jgi:CheY-like chemotaxis protein